MSEKEFCLFMFVRPRGAKNCAKTHLKTFCVMGRLAPTGIVLARNLACGMLSLHLNLGKVLAFKYLNQQEHLELG